MSEQTLLLERLQMILSALQRIPDRFSSIEKPDDFMSSASGLEHMDSICMVLIAAGEELKKIDRDTNGQYFSRYPQVPWRGAIAPNHLLYPTPGRDFETIAQVRSLQNLRFQP